LVGVTQVRLAQGCDAGCKKWGHY